MELDNFGYNHVSLEYSIKRRLKKLMYRACKMNIKKNDKKVILELLSSCNLKCTHCFYRTSNEFNSPDYLPKEDIFKLIDKMVTRGINKIVLTGGEPTLRPDFLDIAKYAILKVPKVSLCTNGVILNDEIKNEIVKLNLSSYTISIDSHIENIHNKFRGSNVAFSQTISFIEKLNINKKNVSIHITIHPDNIDSIEETIIFCKKLSNEVVVSSIYYDKLEGYQLEDKYRQQLNHFKEKFYHSPEIILVGFTPFCNNKDCLDHKNIFTINRKGNLVNCYWKEKGGTVIGKY